MEHENNYASKGVAGTALGFGIGALGAELFGGNLGNLFGGNRCNNGNGNDAYVNRYEFGLQQEIAAKDAKIGLLESNIYTDGKIADVYERLNAKISGIEAQICQQNVYNATNTAAIGCINGQIAQLMGLIRPIIPIEHVCPQPMPQFNSWTAPTAAG